MYIVRHDLPSQRTIEEQQEREYTSYKKLDKERRETDGATPGPQQVGHDMTQGNCGSGSVRIVYSCS